jgi:hypothetical protein
MHKSKMAQIAYLAGIIDGEGSFTIRKKTYSNGRTLYTPRITIGMNTAQPLDLAFGLFGGSIRARRTTGENVPYIFCWEVSCTKAKEAAKTILPFLRVKREQAVLLMDLQTRIQIGKKNRTWSTKNGKNSIDPLSDHELKRREEMWLKMKDLNLPRNVSPAGAETKQIELDGKYSIPLVSDSPFQREKKPLVIG